MSYFISLILAIALPFFRISPFLNRTWLVAMSAIVLLHTASDSLVYSVNWIGVAIFSDILTNFFFTKSSGLQGIRLEEITLLLSSLPLIPIKPSEVPTIEEIKSRAV
jgi:hypothetical protein